MIQDAVFRDANLLCKSEDASKARVASAHQGYDGNPVGARPARLERLAIRGHSQAPAIHGFREATGFPDTGSIPRTPAPSRRAFVYGKISM
ncbi:Hypothetical protein GbCGDNIH2_1053 [Granulibacter bethesdensis]|uniref:Uncharacterized protein n=1 Tax=Granulibacter bethesdensis (strain ATCC BAA-1260 / CGDNIH1) TaxID=391165 RepID=Q0BTA1_GRABC|nr:Hypothetical protein GbCGDNIH1_1053 [Granulibacter bethesdensis CGDNIH1]APG30620.1 Hypothetical protein GbCGDNIH2_1053 [Granulibacter bethesdensis]APH51767.1 Hypothetical protein GbCGDNIH5_1053 [Granulibacter bethesdensis]APH64459.1 Hypothetical protein GbCGDNIH1I4_1053 [Granulibacter bethesdensis]